MSDLVPAADIENIVGMDRHPTRHSGRAVSEEQTVYVLHSFECLALYEAGNRDLRECPYSAALDNGIDLEDWYDSQDIGVWLGITSDGALVPAAEPSAEPDYFSPSPGGIAGLVADLRMGRADDPGRTHFYGDGCCVDPSTGNGEQNV